MRNPEVTFIFFFSFGNSIAWENCFKKSKLFVEAEIWNLDSFEYVEFDGNFLFFFFRLKKPFLGLFCPKIENCQFKLIFDI